MRWASHLPNMDIGTPASLIPARHDLGRTVTCRCFELLSVLAIQGTHVMLLSDQMCLLRCQKVFFLFGKPRLL